MLVVRLRWTLTSIGVECANFQSPGPRSAATAQIREATCATALIVKISMHRHPWK